MNPEGRVTAMPLSLFRFRWYGVCRNRSVHPLNRCATRIGLTLLASFCVLAACCFSAAAAAAHARQVKDLYTLEAQFRENALKAETSYNGKTITFDIFVVGVDKVNGKPHIKAYILYSADGVEAISEIFLKPTQLATAMKLKPNDHIKVTGTLKSRKIYSKESVEISGYTSSVINGYGGGGSVNGGSVTRSWPVYTVESAYVSVIETAAARAQKEASAAAKKEALTKQFTEALFKSDFVTAQKAVDGGLDPAVINGMVNEIARYDPDSQNYDAVMGVFKFLMMTKKADVGNAIAKSVGFEIASLPRPKMFKTLVDLKGINFEGKFPYGDNLLLFLVKDKTELGLSGKAPKSLRHFYTELDYEMIKIISESGQAKGAADVKDSYGKSAKDYFEAASGLLRGSSSETSPFARIKELIAKME